MLLRVLQVSVVGAVALAVGCGGSDLPSLRARSSSDLHCAAEAVKIYQLDERAYRVVGCEQEVVYIAICDVPVGYPERKCTWHVDSSRNATASTKQPESGASGKGCSFDTQCKGDRICVQGQCVAPTAAPAPVGSTPSSAPTP